MKRDIRELIERLWADYASLNPQARRIVELLRARGLTVFNDHIAFRTYNDPKINVDALARSFLESGYEPKGSYTFTEKRLTARHYEHPDRELPKVFISQLMVEQFPDPVGVAVRDLVEQVTDDLPRRWDFPVSGRPWRVSHAAYEALGEHSEYAAWLSAFGFRANHFTVDVGRLSSLNDLAEFNAFIESSGFPLNTSGGADQGVQGGLPGAVLDAGPRGPRPVHRRDLPGARVLLRVRQAVRDAQRGALRGVRRQVGRQDLREHRPANVTHPTHATKSDHEGGGPKHLSRARGTDLSQIAACPVAKSR